MTYVAIYALPPPCYNSGDDQAPAGTLKPLAVQDR